ncbi:MAG: hypothetical protein Q8R92_00445 [Deltaproteobacteria bacterium]|nr:hypothetical protein [Deltaproteobacteria bacterium]
MARFSLRLFLPLLVLGLTLIPVARNHAQDALPPADVPDAVAVAVADEAPSTTAAAFFSRQADPVVIKGEQLPAFLGSTEDKMRVFAKRDGKLRPIPYQMDERNQWGEFVLHHGKRVVPDEDSGEYDENDELVFITRDLGAKAPKSEWPTGTKEAFEVEVTDPLTSDKAYAYVMLYETASAAPAPSTVDYVTYEQKGGGLIRATNYEIGWLKSSSGLDYNHLVVTKEAGGDNINHFDKLKIRVLQNLRRFLTLGLSPRLDRSEENFLVKVYGYRDGPVRVLRVMKVNLQLVWKLPAPGATVNYVFYPEWMEIPVPINLPFKPTWAFYDLELDTSHDYDFDPKAGVKVYSSKTDRWDVVDGKMSPEETAVNKEEVKGTYAGYDGSAAGVGSAFFTIRAPKSFPVKILGLYLDDPEDGLEPEYYEGDGNKKNRTEWIKGSSFLGGYRFIDWEGVSKGIHTVYYYQFYPPHYKPGGEKAFLNIIDHPVAVSIN